MKKFYDVIKKSTIFKGISDLEIQEVLRCLEAKTERFLKDEFILQFGDHVDSVGLLLSGSAFIIQEDFWGNRNLVAPIRPGRLFAEAFACSSETSLNVSVLAGEDCIVMWLDIRKILSGSSGSCSYHSQIIRNLLSDLADKNLYFSEKIMHMGKRSTKDKLLSYLSAEAQRQGKSEFDIPFNRQQLADFLAVERSAMSAELSKLRKDGRLQFCKNHFCLIHQ